MKLEIGKGVFYFVAITGYFKYNYQHLLLLKGERESVCVCVHVCMRVILFFFIFCISVVCMYERKKKMWRLLEVIITIHRRLGYCCRF